MDWGEVLLRMRRGTESGNQIQHMSVKNVLRIAQFLALCICSFESGQVFTGQRVPSVKKR